ncbi:hypothetical protein ACQY0O_005717 [Thecaphora frezii]
MPPATTKIDVKHTADALAQPATTLEASRPVLLPRLEMPAPPDVVRCLAQRSHEAKRVEFDGICQVIPHVDHKQLRKLLRAYALACDRHKEELDPNEPPRTTTSKPSRPRYGLRVVSVPLFPGQWGAGNIKSSLANLNLASKIDLSVVAASLAAAPSTRVATSCRASASSSSVNEIQEHDDLCSETVRDRRMRSFSDDERWFQSRSTVHGPEDVAEKTSLGFGFGGGGGAAQPAAPRVLRMKVPTFSGSRKEPSVPEAPRKGCLVRANTTTTTSSTASQGSHSRPPSSESEPASSSLRMCFEGPPVRQAPSELKRATSPCSPEERPGQPSMPTKAQARASLSLLRRASSFGRRSSVQRGEDAAADATSASPAKADEDLGIDAPYQGLSEAAIKRELKAGRWPFHEPLHCDCICKGCTESIAFANTRAYRPRWTRSARAKWLADRRERETLEQAAASALSPADSGSRPSSRPTSRGRIQADEVDRKLGTGSRPQTPKEEADEEAAVASPPEGCRLPTCDPPPGQADAEAAGAEASAEIGASAIHLSTGVIVAEPDQMEGDEELEREIDSRRTSIDSRSSYRPGARSMMRQLEEADRVEQQASLERQRRRNSWSPSIGSSPNPVQQLNVGGYFDLPRTGSPLSSPRPTLDPIAEGGGRFVEPPRLSPLRDIAAGSGSPVAPCHFAKADQLPEMPHRDDDAAAAVDIGTKAKKRPNTKARSASKAFFGLLGSSFGGSGAPPG